MPSRKGLVRQTEPGTIWHRVIPGQGICTWKNVKSALSQLIPCTNAEGMKNQCNFSLACDTKFTPREFVAERMQQIQCIGAVCCRRTRVALTKSQHTDDPRCIK